MTGNNGGQAAGSREEEEREGKGMGGEYCSAGEPVDAWDTDRKWSRIRVFSCKFRKMGHYYRTLSV
jgi:hypothetical protein